MGDLAKLRGQLEFGGGKSLRNPTFRERERERERETEGEGEREKA